MKKKLKKTIYYIIAGLAILCMIPIRKIRFEDE